MTPSKNLTHQMEIHTGRRLTPLPLQWEDSANWLWKSEGLSPELIKLARTDPEHDPFWRGLKRLFGFDRWSLAEQLPHLTEMLPVSLPIIPLSLKFISRLENKPIWSLPWQEGSHGKWTAAFAEQLGHQIGQLHQQSFFSWGHPLTATLSLDEWPCRVQQYLSHTPEHEQLSTLIDQLSPIPTRAVWCLPDLRADQFMQDAMRWVWSDWEALIWAPIEFDWCLLELLLETSMLQDVFCKTYCYYASPPDLTAHRPHCRAILWTMNSFGVEPWSTFQERQAWV